MNRDCDDVKEIIRLERKVLMMEDDQEPLKQENRKMKGEASRLRQVNEQLSNENLQLKMRPFD